MDPAASAWRRVETDLQHAESLLQRSLQRLEDVDLTKEQTEQVTKLRSTVSTLAKRADEFKTIREG